MLTHLVASLVLGTFTAALLFLIGGVRLMMRVPTIKRFREAKSGLSSVTLPSTVILKPVELKLAVFCHKYLIEVISGQHAPVVERFNYREIGDVVELVHYRERTLKRIVKELRTYTYLLLILGIVGVGQFLYESRSEFSFPVLWQWAGQHPFQLIGFFELTVILLFWARLVIELGSIRELLDG